MATLFKETKGTGMHATSLRHEKPIDEQPVVDIHIGAKVYRDEWGWGVVKDITYNKSGTVILVGFYSKPNAICKYKIPDDFISGKISRYPRKSY